MQKKEATGVDTLAMLPVFGSIYVIVCMVLLPWLSMPVLKYSKLPVSYSLWKIDSCVDNIQKSIEQGGKLRMPPLEAAEAAIIGQAGAMFRAAAVILTVMMVICAVLAYKKKRRSLVYVRICFSISALMVLAAFAAVWCSNLFINQRAGRASDFVNMTIHSYIQLTSWQYAQFILSIIMIICAGKLLDTKADSKPQMYIERSLTVDRKMGKRTLVSLILILTAIPLVIFFGIYFLNDRSNSFIALCIIGLAMIPFCMVFEGRKPQAREILLIAVMSAIAVAGRMAFFMIPQFKPVAAIVIITGAGLGAEAGFLTGAVAGFVSNFFFGQGPWTPWQMFAFGIIGFLAGLIFCKKGKSQGRDGKTDQWQKMHLCIYGGFATLIIYGLLLDTASVTMFSKDFTWQNLTASYISGFPFSVIHAVSTVIFLFFLSDPMDRKLERIKKKYGILSS